MMAFRSFALGLAIAATAAFAACSSDDSGTGAGGPGGTGAAPGTGGGGAPPTTTTTTTSSGGGDGPIDCPPSSPPYSNVIVDDCDLLQQDCGPGKTCRPIETSPGVWKTKCRGDTGLKGPGKACSVDQECEAGLFCIGAPEGWCSPVCCQGTNEPCGGGACNINVDLDGVPNVNTAFMMMCSFAPECELLTVNACKTGTECHLSDASQGLATCTAPSGTQVDEGGTCAFLNDCKDMQHCFGEPDGSRCRYYCLVSGGEGLTPGLGGCPAGQACADIDIGVPGVGICQPSAGP